MKTAYARCADGKVTGIPEKSDKKTAAKGSLWDFLLPLVTVIVLVIANGEKMCIRDRISSSSRSYLSLASRFRIHPSLSLIHI